MSASAMTAESPRPSLQAAPVQVPLPQAAPPPRPRRKHHIPELLHIHADELAYIWGQRRAALQDTRYTLKSYLDLNDRIEGHVAGLLAVPSALPALLGPRLAAVQDRDEAFAAAHGLLRLADPALTERIGTAFAAATGPLLLGLRDAMAFAPLGATRAALQKLLAQDDPARAVAAATVLAHHKHLNAQDPGFTRLLLAEDAGIAEQAWRVLTRLDARTEDAQNPSPRAIADRPYAEVLQRPEPGLLGAAFGAALWSAQPWALPLLRRRTEQGDAVALAWLAGIGGTDDIPLLHAAMAVTLPPLAQATLLGRSGHPQGLPLLAAWMQGEDPHLAAAAATAFTRITGHDVRGQRITPPPREGADEFEREMAPSVWLPDKAKVAAHLQQHGGDLARCERWNHGMPLPVGASSGDLAKIDLPARWDACARATARGQPVAAPPPAA